ncbi:flagellin, partial [Methylobacterium gossipiicola]
QLNASLATVNAQASIDSVTGKIAITTTNDYGADNLSVSVSGGTAFAAGTSSAIIGGDGAAARRNAVASYNNLLTQINQLASDAGFNGLNLLAGDNLKVVFNEKGSSLLSVQGSTVNISNLGLGPIDTDGFQENGLIAKVMTAISSASSQLKAQASSLGSNLAVVQNRQDFTKQIINVLDTGAGNLVNADLNEEAANSQALSTRNSLGISALALANQAQQGVLQLLR